MRSWQQRPGEIRTLFNPAFCGLTLFRALSGFEELDTRGMPFSLSLLVLPLCLHKQSRETFEKGKRNYLLKIVSTHPELLVDFGKRTTDLLPFTFEGLGFLMSAGAMTVSADGLLKPTSGIVRKSVTGTDESIACQRVARFIGKEFASIGDRATIYTTLGVRP